MTAQSAHLAAEHAGTRLDIVGRSQLGLGDVMASPHGPQLIHGVEVEAIAQFPDDRGCFAELFRFGEPGLARDFDPASGSRIQVPFTISYPEVKREAV